MRLLYVNDYDRFGGAEEVMHTLASTMNRFGNEVFFATPDGITERNHFRLERMPLRIAIILRHSILFNKDPSVSRSIKRVIARTKPDLMHCHNLWLTSLSPVISAYGRGIPTVVTFHDYWPVCLNRALKEDGGICAHTNWKGGLLGCRFRSYDYIFRPFVERGMLARRAVLSERTAALVAVSNYVKQVMVRFGYPSNLITVIHNGVDVSRFHPPERKKSKGLALYLGGLHPPKGFPHFLSLASRLKREIAWARFRAVGLDPEMANGVLETSRRLPLAELVKSYQEASCLVIPSLWPEPFPTVALEALACGTPVVAYDTGGISEIVDNRETGFLVARGDVSNLAEKVRYLLENPSVCEEMGEKGRMKVVDLFSQGTMSSNYSSLYDKVRSNAA